MTREHIYQHLLIHPFLAYPTPYSSIPSIRSKLETTQASNLYCSLADSPRPGANLFPDLPEGTRLQISPMWDARVSGPYIILKNRHPCAAGANLVLTSIGFTYLGCKDTSGLFEDSPRYGHGSGPRAVILQDDLPPRYGAIEDAWRNFTHALGEMPSSVHYPSGHGGVGEERDGDEADYGTACPSGGGGGGGG